MEGRIPPGKWAFFACGCWPNIGRNGRIVAAWSDYVEQALWVVEQLSRGVADEPEQRQKQREDLLAARKDLDELLSHWVA